MKKRLYLPIYLEKEKQKGKGMKIRGIGIRQTTTENKWYKKQLWLTGRNVHFHVQRSGK